MGSFSTQYFYFVDFVKLLTSNSIGVGNVQFRLGKIGDEVIKHKNKKFKIITLIFEKLGEV